MKLSELPVGQKAKILRVNGEGALRNRLLDMGLTPKTEVMIQKVAPMGDPVELTLRGYELTLRLEDAAQIEVQEEEIKVQNIWEGDTYGICASRQPEQWEDNII